MGNPTEQPKRITLRTIQLMVEAGEQIPVLTCYDATTAKHLAAGGVPAILVGDTASEMILGFDTTIHVDMNFMIAITAAVRRGAPHVFLMGDMPFMSYQPDEAEAIRNAARFLTEGNADVVKIEICVPHLPLVEKMSAAGIPVVAHIGSRPQMARRTGGYRSAGRTARDALHLVELAQRVEDAGATMLLIEACPAEVSERIVKRVSIPVIGCGAGSACHGHVVVLHDLLGLTDWHPPFVQPAVNLGGQVVDAASNWVELIQSGEYLKKTHPYKMKAGEAEKFATDL